MRKQRKKVTLESLAATMEAGFKRMDTGFKDVKEDNESLARMVAGGFEHTTKDIAGLKADVGVLKTDVGELKTDVGSLQTDVSDIKLRLDYLAPKFEVRDLERRVKRLEDKTGIRHTVRH